MGTLRSAEGEALAANVPDSVRRKSYRTLNLRFCLPSLAIALALGAGGVLLYRYQVGRLGSTWLERADRCEQSGEYAEAAEYLQRFVRLFPEENQQRIRLAEVFDKSVTDPRDFAGRRQVVALHYRAIGVAGPDDTIRLRKRLCRLLTGQQQYAAAEVQARAIVAAAPRDPGAWRLLGLLLSRDLATAAPSRVESSGSATEPSIGVGEALAQALQLNSADGEIAVLMAEVYRSHPELLSNEQAQEVREQAKAAHVDAQLQRASIADKIVNVAVGTDPDNADLLLARHRYRGKFHVDGADADLDHALELDPDNPNVLLVAGQRARRLADSAQDTDRTKHLRAAEEYFRRVLTARSAGADHASEEHLEPCRQAYIALGQVALTRQDPSRAIETFREGLGVVGKDDLRLNIYLANALTIAGQPAAADGVLRTLDSSLKELGPWLSPEALLALRRSRAFVRGSLFQHKGQITAAIREFRTAAMQQQIYGADRELEFCAWKRLGAAYSQLGQWDRAAAALENALQLSPDSLDTLLATGAAWEHANQPQEAIDHYASALSRVDQSELWLAMARAQVLQQSRLAADQRDWSAAEQALEKTAHAADAGQLDRPWRSTFLQVEYVIARTPELQAWPPGGASLLQFPVSNTRVWTLSESHCDFLQRLFPDLDVLIHCREALDAWQRRTDPTGHPSEVAQRLMGRLCHARLAQVEASLPTDADCWRRLALLYERLERTREADAASQRFAELTGNSLGGLLLKAELLTRRGKHAQARQLLQQWNGEGARERTSVKTALVRVGLQEGTAEGRELAEDLLRELRNERPHDVSVSWQLAQLALEDGRISEVDVCEHELRRVEGEDGLLWRTVRAQKLLMELSQAPPDPDGARYLEARKLVAALELQRPSWPDVWVLRARLDSYVSRWEEAVNSFQKAVKLGAQSMGVYRDLIALLFRLGRFPEASRYLDQIEHLGPADAELSRMSISVALALGDRPAALELARQQVQDRPDDPDSWIWYSHMLLLDGRRQEAEQSMRTAVELGPDDLRVLNALFAFSIRCGHLERAEQALEELCRKTTFRSQAERLIVEAQGSEFLGQEAKAKDFYLRAAEAGPDNAAIQVKSASFFASRDAETAERLLRRALVREPRHRRARRDLASLLMAKGNTASWKEARQVLGEDDDSDLALRLKALLMVQQRGRDLEAARSILEGLVAKNSDPNDRFVLANVFLLESPLQFSREKREEKLEQARRHYHLLASRDGADPTHVMRLIDFLVRYDSRDSAAQWLPGLKAAMLASGEPKTLGLIRYARFLLDTGFVEEAGQPLDEVEPLLPDSTLENQGFYVDLRLRQGSLEQADKWIEQLEQAQPHFLSTAARRARYLKLAGRTEAIPPLVDDFANRWLQQQGDRAEKARLALAVGRLYSSLELPDAAERWLRKVRDFEPLSYQPLAENLARRGRRRDLIELCSAARNLDASSRPAIVLARCLTLAKPPPEDDRSAERLLRVALEANPRDADLLCAVAGLRQSQARYDEAAALCEQALAVRGDSAEAIGRLAFVLSRQPNKINDALVRATVALKLEGPKAELLATKGMAYVLDGRPRDGIDLLKAAASTINAQAIHQFYYALALARSGDLTGARSVWQGVQRQDLEASLPPCDRDLYTELQSLLN